MLMLEWYSMMSDWYSLCSYLYGSGLIRYGVSSTPLSWAEICEVSYPVLVTGRWVHSLELVSSVVFCNDALRRSILCSSLRCWWDQGPSRTIIASGLSGVTFISTACPLIWLLWAVGFCWQIPGPSCCQFVLASVAAGAPVPQLFFAQELPGANLWRGLLALPLLRKTWRF